MPILDMEIARFRIEKVYWEGSWIECRSVVELEERATAARGTFKPVGPVLQQVVGRLPTETHNVRLKNSDDRLRDGRHWYF